MTDSQKWFVLAGTSLTALLLYLLAPVLTPFLIAAVLAYIGDPLVDRLEPRLKRTGAVVTVFLILSLMALLVLLVLVPMLERQIALLIHNLPQYIDWLQQKVLPGLFGYFGVEEKTLDLASLKQLVAKQWSQAGGIAASVLKAVSSSGLTLLAWLTNLLLIPVVTFYLLRDWDILVARVHELLPRRYEPVVVRLVAASDEVLGAFLRGQLMVMSALALIYTVGLWMVGLQLALLIGLLAGVVSFVPYLGFIVGIAAAGIAALMQFHDVVPLVYVGIVFMVGQLVEGMVLTPMFVGERIGLHPVAVIFAVLAGGQLFGFFGVLLALPVAAVVMVLLRYAHERYVDSELYGPRSPQTAAVAEQTADMPEAEE